MIGQENQQQSKSWSVLSQGLADLGQQVGKQLALREYEKQAQSALPALQQKYSNALDKIQTGDLTSGYRDILNAQLEYGSSQNPFIANMNQMAGSVAEKAASDFLKTRIYEMQYGGRRQTTPQSGLPAVNPSDYGFGPNETDMGTPLSDPNMDAFSVNPDVPQPSLIDNATQDQIDQQATAQLPTNAPTPSATPAPTPSASPAPAPTPQGTPQQQAAAKNVGDVLALPVDQQATAARQFTLTEDALNPKQYELVKVPGLEEYLEGFVGFAVPTEKFEATTARELQGGGIVRGSQKVAPQARKNFFDGIDKNSSTQQNLKNAVDTMKDRQMTALFNEFGGDIYALRSATGATPSRTGGDTYTVEKKDGKVTPLTSSQYMAIQTIASIVPSTAENAAGTPAIFKARKQTPMDLVATAKQELGPQATKEQILARARELASQ